MTDLRGRSVIVVGATGGLGRPVAALLAAEGARLTLVARSEERLATLGIPGVTMAVDIRKAASAARIVEAAQGAYGGVDGVVFAAGIVAFGSIADTPDDVVIDLFTTNTLAPLRLMRAAVPALRESAAAKRDPFVINVSAVVAEQAMAGMAAYSASKAALTSYDAAATRELRREGIRVVDVRPPHTETGLVLRAVHGEAPRLPEGLSPDAVAARIVGAITGDDKDVASTDFG